MVEVQSRKGRDQRAMEASLDTKDLMYEFSSLSLGCGAALACCVCKIDFGNDATEVGPIAHVLLQTEGQ
jgi:hypothetical protein